MPKIGMVIALMDEYRKSTIELKKILSDLTQADFEQICDLETKDEDCRSIKTVIFHVVQSGYTYSNYFNQLFDVDWYEFESVISSPNDGVEAIDEMLNFTESALDHLHVKSQKEIESYSIKSRWNVTYDIEQLVEHAIVHILRHRRQIENFIISRN